MVEKLESMRDQQIPGIFTTAAQNNIQGIIVEVGSDFIAVQNTGAPPAQRVVLIPFKSIDKIALANLP
jgi:hypothetical protein